MKAFASAMLAATATASNHWAVIVAGSNSFWNYRHQADAHHAYNLMLKNGIPEENAIFFAFDDVANSPLNPIPGTIYN